MRRQRQHYITFQRAQSRNEKGFILPYTYVLLMMVILTGMAAKELFISKYLYLTNMKGVLEREVSVSHAVLMEIEGGMPSAKQVTGTYGEIDMISEGMNPLETRLVVTFKRGGEVFLPATVVYNRETKDIISWE